MTPDTESEETAKPGEVVDAGPLGNSLHSAHTPRWSALGPEVVRLIVHSGHEIPPRVSKGEMIVQCLEGRVALTARGKTQVLKSGNLLNLPGASTMRSKGSTTPPSC